MMMIWVCFNFAWKARSCIVNHVLIGICVVHVGYLMFFAVLLYFKT